MIPSSALVLPPWPIARESEVIFLSSKGNKSAAKDTLHIFGLQSKQWKCTEIAISASQNQVAFPLLYKDDVAIIRATMENQSAKVGIYKLKERSHWEPIPFTIETINAVDFKNCQCAQSTRCIVLVSVALSTITFHVHKYSSQTKPWTSMSFSLSPTRASSCSVYVLQSCAIAHQTLYCSLISTVKDNQQKVTIYKVKLESVMEKDRSYDNVDFEEFCTFDPIVTQCHLFFAGREIMAMKVIVNNGEHRSSTLELCSLNDSLALVNFKQQKKDYTFVTEVLSVIPLHSTAPYNNHVLIVYRDNQLKTYLEIFCLPPSSCT